MGKINPKKEKLKLANATPPPKTKKDHHPTHSSPSFSLTVRDRMKRAVNNAGRKKVGVKSFANVESKQFLDDVHKEVEAAQANTHRQSRPDVEGGEIESRKSSHKSNQSNSPSVPHEAQPTRAAAEPVNMKPQSMPGSASKVKWAEVTQPPNSSPAGAASNGHGSASHFTATPTKHKWTAKPAPPVEGTDRRPTSPNSPSPEMPTPHVDETVEILGQSPADPIVLEPGMAQEQLKSIRPAYVVRQKSVGYGHSTNINLKAAQGRNLRSPSAGRSRPQTSRAGKDVSGPVFTETNVYKQRKMSSSTPGSLRNTKSRIPLSKRMNDKLSSSRLSVTPSKLFQSKKKKKPQAYSDPEEGQVSLQGSGLLKPLKSDPVVGAIFDLSPDDIKAMEEKKKEKKPNPKHESPSKEATKLNHAKNLMSNAIKKRKEDKLMNHKVPATETAARSTVGNTQQRPPVTASAPHLHHGGDNGRMLPTASGDHPNHQTRSHDAFPSGAATPRKPPIHERLRMANSSRGRRFVDVATSKSSEEDESDESRHEIELAGTGVHGLTDISQHPPTVIDGEGKRRGFYDQTETETSGYQPTTTTSEFESDYNGMDETQSRLAGDAAIAAARARIVARNPHRPADWSSARNGVLSTPSEQTATHNKGQKEKIKNSQPPSSRYNERSSSGQMSTGSGDKSSYMDSDRSAQLFPPRSNQGPIVCRNGLPVRTIWPRECPPPAVRHRYKRLSSQQPLRWKYTQSQIRSYEKVVGTRFKPNSLFSTVKMPDDAADLWDHGERCKKKKRKPQKTPNSPRDHILTNALRVIRQRAKLPEARFVDHPRGHTQSWYKSGWARNFVTKPGYGCVPEYILERKRELCFCHYDTTCPGRTRRSEACSRGYGFSNRKIGGPLHGFTSTFNDQCYLPTPAEKKDYNYWNPTPGLIGEPPVCNRERISSYDIFQSDYACKVETGAIFEDRGAFNRVVRDDPVRYCAQENLGQGGCGTRERVLAGSIVEVDYDGCG